MIRKTRYALGIARSDLRDHGRVWLPLGTTAMGLAAAITILSVFFPVLLARFTDSQTLIGFAIGGEGLFALALSILVGPLSDRIRTPWGRRRPFMALGALLAAAGLALAPLMPSYWTAVAVVFAFYVGYYFVGTPYRALAPDILPADQYARALGYQQLLRGLGFILGFGVGSIFFAVHQILPFEIVAALLLLAVGVTVFFIREPALEEERPLTLRRELVELWQAWRGHRELRRALLANFLFEAQFAGLRTFIVLFFLRGLGLSFNWVIIAVGIVTAANVVGAILSGYAADRFGVRRVLYWAALICGLAYLIPFFRQDLWIIFVLLPPLAIVGAAIITLSFPLVMEIMPEHKRGGYSGIFELARGLGIVVGPVVTGAAIDIYASLSGPQHGYPAMWLALSAITLLSVVALRRLNLDTQKAAA